MKKLNKIVKLSILSTVTATLLNAGSSYIGYQGVAYNNDAIVSNQTVDLMFTVYQSDGTTKVYEEKQLDVTTTAQGFFSHNIGSGTITVAPGINWHDNILAKDYKLGVQIDLDSDDTGYTDMGIQDFSSVGYSNVANKLSTARTISLTGGVTGSTTFDGSGNASISATVANVSTSSSANTIVKRDASGHFGVTRIGIGTNSPLHPLHVATKNGSSTTDYETTA